MNAFETTFLGHQGWLFSSNGTHLLVDPLLTSAIGHAGSVGDVYPPRLLDFDAMPPISAVFLSHEHEDHFDIPTLARIDRTVPILLSVHSSVAARAVLRDLGFRVQLVTPGARVTVGDLELHTFAPARTEDGDEWDVLPYLVRDTGGAGSFFTMVDVAFHAGVEQALRKIVDRPGIWCFTNNAIDLSFTQAGLERPKWIHDSASLARSCIEQWTTLAVSWRTPAAALFCGGGYCFAGDREWLNRNSFRTDSRHVADALSALWPSQFFSALKPGQVASMVDGALHGGLTQSAFLRCPPESEWPDRTFGGEVQLLQDYEPFTRAGELTDDELRELERELDHFGKYLYSSNLLRDLYALDAGLLGSRRPTISLVLRFDREGGAYVYEYDPASGSFVSATSDDPVEDYVGGLECWAADLLELFRGSITVSAVAFGRGRAWNFFPDHLAISLQPFIMYTHPLRRPEQARVLYEVLKADAASEPICVKPGPRPDIRMDRRGS